MFTRSCAGAAVVRASSAGAEVAAPITRIATTSIAIAEAYGAAAFLAQPFSPTVLLRAIERLRG